MSRAPSTTAHNCTDFNEIDVLPDELLIVIFKFLHIDDILECENVCQRWRKLARDAALWRHKPIVYSGKPGQSEVSERNLEIINTHSECIHHLKLQYIFSYPVLKSVMDKCDNLISLELVMCRISKEFELYVTRWLNLRKLNLKSVLLVSNTEDPMIQYDQFKHLKYLALSDIGFSPKNCDTLLNCTYLNHIFIDKIKGLSLEYIRRLILAKQKKLIALHIYGGDAIDDKCLYLLSQCPLLKDLAITRCENLTDEGLKALADLKQIEHLQIWNNTKFSEFYLLKTLGSPALVTIFSLSLSRISNISPVIVDLISEHYKNIKFLALYQCPRIINTDYEKQLESKFRNIDVVLY